MASGTRPTQNPYGDPYAEQHNGSAPAYSAPFPEPQYQLYNDEAGKGGMGIPQQQDFSQYRAGPQEEEMLRDQYHHPDNGDLAGGYHDRLHPNSQYGYDNPYAPASEGHDTTGASSIGPWDSASQRSIAASSMLGPPNHLRNKPSSGGLSYIDEEGGYYRSNTQRPASEIEMRGLVHDPSPMAGRHDMGGDIEFSGVKGNDYDTSPLAHPTHQMPKYQKPSGVWSWLLFPTGLDRVLAIFGVNLGKMPLEQEIERKRRGIPGQRFPIAAWGLTLSKSTSPARARAAR